MKLLFVISLILLQGTTHCYFGFDHRITQLLQWNDDQHWDPEGNGGNQVKRDYRDLFPPEALGLDKLDAQDQDKKDENKIGRDKLDTNNVNEKNKNKNGWGELDRSDKNIMKNKNKENKEEDLNIGDHNRGKRRMRRRKNKNKIFEPKEDKEKLPKWIGFVDSGAVRGGGGCQGPQMWHFSMLGLAKLASNLWIATLTTWNMMF